MHVCSTCGALVQSPTTHEAWHKALLATLTASATVPLTETEMLHVSNE